MKAHFEDIKFAQQMYPDTTAVHMADNVVLDKYYGSERDNQVFIVFPTDVIASQFPFQVFGQGEKALTGRGKDDLSSDVLVWAGEKENPGLMIDAGIVFLPKTTPVDPETGSKYASEIKDIDGKEVRVIIENTQLVDSFVKFGLENLLNNDSNLRQIFEEYKSEPYYWKDEKRRICLVNFAQELQVLGFAPDVSSTLGYELFSELHWRQDLTDEVLRALASKCRANWKRVENPVPAEEYWESYFAKNPHLKPRHVWYYDGDPTSAVLELQQQNNIGRADTSKTEGQLLGFDDHHVLDMEKDPRANAGYDDLVARADKIIEKYYRTKAV